jgi:non-heme Fe2+,alpha-ketoglutarate-dependent halogenase
VTADELARFHRSGDEGTDWHQADTFPNASGSPQIVWPDDAEFGGTITVWCSFTDASIDMGCLQFIPGTHQTMFYDETKRMHYDPNKVNSLQVDADACLSPAQR